MKKVILLLCFLSLVLLSQAQTSINITLNKTNFCVGDSLEVTIAFNRPPNAYYTGFYGFNGTLTSGYTDYSQYTASNASSGTLKISLPFLSTNDSIFKITVGDSINSSPWTIETKYSVPFKVHVKPFAQFRYLNAKSQCENRGIHFNLFSFADSSICPPGSFIAKWSWYFGDGNAIVGGTSTANHSYNYNFNGDSSNSYTVSLKVTDIFGCTDSTSQYGFTIHPVPVAKPVLTNAAVQCQKENLFNFIDSSFFFANTSETMMRKWTFEATDSSFNANINKHYAQHGVKQVKLVCYSMFGCGDTASLFVTVKPAPEALTISGSTSVTSWSSHTYSLPNTSGSTYTWSVTNGTVSSGAGTNSVMIQWNNAPSGIIRVVETNADGCSGDTSLLTVQISPNSVRNLINGNYIFALPNPFTGSVSVQPAPAWKGPVALEVYELTGKRIYSKTVDFTVQGESITIPEAAEWQKGVYMITLTGKSIHLSQKLVKQ